MTCGDVCWIDARWHKNRDTRGGCARHNQRSSGRELYNTATRRHPPEIYRRDISCIRPPGHESMDKIQSNIRHKQSSDPWGRKQRGGGNHRGLGCTRGSINDRECGNRSRHIRQYRMREGFCAHTDFKHLGSELSCHPATSAWCLFPTKLPRLVLLQGPSRCERNR